MTPESGTIQMTPGLQAFEAELKRLKRAREFRRILRSTVYILLVVAAVAVLIASIFFPILRITGTSMEPTIESGQVVLAMKWSRYDRGDLVAFYYNNKVLIKRVIGTPGDIINIDRDGNVQVNGESLQEPYISESSLGECDLDFPYQVPESRIFVLGDHRATSIDSRSSQVGCIPEERMIGRLLVRVWPLTRIGPVL